MILYIEGKKAKTMSYLKEYIPTAIEKPEDSQADIILNWGGSNSVTSRYFTFNQSVEVIWNAEEREKILGYNQILTPYSGSNKRRYLKARYRVEIFDLHVLRVLVRYGQRTALTTLHDLNKKTTRQICETAISVLYVLGLDFGSVILGITGDNRRVLLDIEPFPSLSSRAARIFGRYIEKQVPLWQSELNFYLEPIKGSWRHIKLGADPEFLLYDRRQNRWLIASDYFPRDGHVGTDARAIYSPRHGYPLAELRPDPAVSPQALIENIRRNIRVGLRYLPCKNVVWVAGSCPLKGFPFLTMY